MSTVRYSFTKAITARSNSPLAIQVSRSRTACPSTVPIIPFWTTSPSALAAFSTSGPVAAPDRCAIAKGSSASAAAASLARRPARCWAACRWSSGVNFDGSLSHGFSKYSCAALREAPSSFISGPGQEQHRRAGEVGLLSSEGIAGCGAARRIVPADRIQEGRQRVVRRERHGRGRGLSGTAAGGGAARLVEVDAFAQQPHELHEQHDLLAEVAVVREELHRGRVRLAGARDLGDGGLEDGVLLAGRGDQVQGLLVVRAGFFEELVGVAEELLWGGHDLVDFILEIGAENPVAGDFEVVGLVDDASGHLATALKDEHVGEEAGCQQKEDAKDSHGRPPDV